jgi:hypothetical protein
MNDVRAHYLETMRRGVRDASNAGVQVLVEVAVGLSSGSPPDVLPQFIPQNRRTSRFAGTSGALESP